MLRELRIRDLAVLRDVVVAPGDGFTALTGETGAGKSLCIAALRAVLGGRLDADLVRAGADAARITAVFDETPAAIREALGGLGVPVDDLLTLTREVPAAGRGACRINGALVSLAVLRQAGEALADVTVQGASHRLQRRAGQREVLDAAAGAEAAALRDRTANAFRRWRSAVAAAAAARAAAASSQAAVSRARELVEDLEPLRLREDEQPVLAAERLRLRHAARLAAAAEELATAAGGEETGAADVLAGGMGAAAQAAALDPGLARLVEDADMVLERLRDLSREAARFAADVVLDDSRLREVEARLDALARVERRHGSIAQALEELSGAARLLATVDGGDDELARLDGEAQGAAAEAAQAAAALSRLRGRTARTLERSVVERLRHLELPHARLRIVLSRSPDAGGLDLGDGVPVRCGEQGVDDVELRLATNPDMIPAPLDQGPSGGELSRLALALAAEVHDAGVPLLVLDEVDTGIGGETAARVGDMLALIGTGRQVLAVTHRPEIAARASTHVVVRRQTDGLSAAASPGDEDRVTEIARLMSGRVTPAARRRAAELLEEGGAAVPAAASGAGAAAAAGRTM